ncbi:MAG: flagellar basal body rod protein FlgB [Clostridiales Family XIII bacterium]|jgi:flagellar basal-body rod protein FlgB|nr:flagellar basal body rod protein FlgB [Clostridiales Family XIII bacterium]
MIGDSFGAAVLQRAMDGAWRREQAVAANIANHDTPGYKAIKVSFEDALDKAARAFGAGLRTREEIDKNLSAIKNSEIDVFQDSAFSERADASNVNLEQENIDMAKVQIQYSYLAREMTDALSRLRYAVREGR